MKTKIGDTLIKLIENGDIKNIYIIVPEEENFFTIVPKIDHELSSALIKIAGLTPSKCDGWFKRELECNRVINALNKDERFFKGNFSGKYVKFIYCKIED